MNTDGGTGGCPCAAVSVRICLHLWQKSVGEAVFALGELGLEAASEEPIRDCQHGEAKRPAGVERQAVAEQIPQRGDDEVDVWRQQRLCFLLLPRV